MDTVLDGGGQLEREMAPEPVAASVTASLILHGLLFGGIAFYAIFNGFHHNWGAPGAGSAIQVSLTSAAIPLPSDQPKTDNVLPTDKPSPAPLPPVPKAKEATVDEKAIPIQGKEIKPEKQKQAPPKPPTKQPLPKPDSRVQYGEQAGQKLSRSTMASR
jgi:protein TonB